MVDPALTQLLRIIEHGESDTVQLQLGINQTKLTTFVGSTPQRIIDYLNQLDHNTFHTWNAQASWSHDTRNKYFTPTHGGLDQLTAEVALPGSTVEYFKLYYQSAHYIPLTDKFTLLLAGNLGYGDYYGTNSVYHFNLGIATGASTIAFQGSSTQDADDEHYGVDNVVVRGNLVDSAAPEPATWAMMILGFGVVGATLRNRRRMLAA